MQGGGVRPGGEGQGERLGGGGAEQVWRGDERARRGSERAGGGGERVGRADKRTGGGGEQVGRGDEWSGRGGERVGRGEERAGRGGGVGGVGRGEKEGVDVALVVGMAFPERLARRRGGGGRGYLMAGGSAVELPEGMGEPEWVAVAAAEWTGRVGVVRVAAVADEGVALRAGEALVVEEDEVRWRDGDVVARRVRRLGAIVVKERALVEPPAELVQAAVLEGLAKEGLGLVRMGEAAGLRERLALVRRVLGEPWPAVDDDALLAAAPVWAAGVRNAAELRALDMKAVLRGLVPWPEAGRIEELAPERIEVPSGSRIKVDYGADPPALPVKIQEVFGWTASPTVVGGRVPVVLHLLSPAGRPAAVTGDLAGFWREGYHRVRAELRGRYPRHRWPEDPTTAEPTRHTTQRRR
ncbi:ATP-dependent helicase C-terminal domain-containing protein [Actinokineospora sp. NPDC004072]